MKILLTNDDGIFAPGIKVLANELSKSHEIYIVAPDTERSAAGHSITIHHPLRVKEHPEFGDNIKAWSVTGTPADCTKIALEAILTEYPDLIISGINNGANLGTDVLYSGTVSAAMEGAIHDITSIAMSINSFTNHHYLAAAKYVPKILDLINSSNLPNILYNVNVPNLPYEEIKGIAVTRLGFRRYKNEFEERLDPRGKKYYWMAGTSVKIDQPEDSDLYKIEEGYVTLTPMHYDMTYDKYLDVLNDKQ